MSEGEHMGILHNWAVYQHAQVIYGVAMFERKGLKEGVNGGKSDRERDGQHCNIPPLHLFSLTTTSKPWSFPLVILILSTPL